MNTRELICLNFNEIRRRSIKVCLGIPADKYHWKPDADAMTCIEMVRHMLESQYIYHQIIVNRGDVENLVSPWEGRPYSNIEDEIAFSRPYQAAFFDMINHLSDQDLDQIEIIRPTRNQRRKLGDYLLRIAYHEAIHTGQLLSYLRTMNIDRPEIWD